MTLIAQGMSLLVILPLSPPHLLNVLQPSLNYQLIQQRPNPLLSNSQSPLPTLPPRPLLVPPSSWICLVPAM